MAQSAANANYTRDFAKSICLAPLEETSPVTLPFMEEQVKARARPDGRGLLALRYSGEPRSLEYFLAQRHKQGLSSWLVAVEEPFHPTTFETYKL